ncbi:MAG: hypothetical protein O6914_06000 [Chloroflexi bacterium]|nr:hypothetical protein [Chloroflexota bacterium]
MGGKKDTIRQLRKLVQRASRENPHLTSRLERAAFLFLLRPIVPLGDHHYQIGSEDGLRQYEVLNGHCQCSDYLRHGAGHPCKHRLALSFYQRLEASESPLSPNRIPYPAEDPLSSDSSPL